MRTNSINARDGRRRVEPNILVGRHCTKPFSNGTVWILGFCPSRFGIPSLGVLSSQRSRIPAAKHRRRELKQTCILYPVSCKTTIRLVHFPDKLRAILVIFPLELRAGWSISLQNYEQTWSFSFQNYE